MTSDEIAQRLEADQKAITSLFKSVGHLFDGNFHALLICGLLLVFEMGLAFLILRLWWRVDRLEDRK